MQALLRELKAFYEKDGRAHLPWRQTRDPYKILVSEVMLQQTQVDRVLPKYREFLRAFPSVQALAKAPFTQVLFHWSGLGYNRRAKFLHEAAKKVVSECKGKFPKAASELQKLPGLGPYTARAVAAFAHNSPEVFIETNIRTVFLYHSNILQNTRMEITKTKSGLVYHTKIADTDLMPLVAEALKESNMQPRDFYAALMDYGSHLKKSGVKLNSKSKHYTKQTKFKGSARELRGAILRELLKSPATLEQLKKKSARTSKEVERELERLKKEGLVVKRDLRFAVAK